MRAWLLALLTIALYAAPGGARAESEVVWTALIYATNEANPAPMPKPLAAFGDKLESLLGYNQLRILSEHRRTMDGGGAAERWLLPGKPFCLSVQSTALPDHQYLLALQLFQEKRLLVKTEAKLARNSPIFFRGPLYGRGQLVIALAVE